MSYSRARLMHFIDMKRRSLKLLVQYQRLLTCNKLRTIEDMCTLCWHMGWIVCGAKRGVAKVITHVTQKLWSDIFPQKTVLTHTLTHIHTINLLKHLSVLKAGNWHVTYRKLAMH